MPAEVTPVNAISLLRRIQSANGSALDPAAQHRLAGDIEHLERSYFAPGAEEPRPGLEPILREWLARANTAG
ncbi:MAG: hypothetical protein IPJ41_11235 [Phycisphaerales bacterium]|nr:hypothetical protein [Phycisphaerales bacterium]